MSMGLPIIAVLTILLCTSAAASPTGLNIIPTADVLSANSANIQIQVTEEDLPSGDEFDDDFQTQFGIGSDTEAGVDTSLKSGGDTFFNGKYRLYKETKRRPAFAVGIQNIGHGATWQPYAVGFKTIGGPRIHLGLMSIDGDIEWMAGSDYTLNDTLTLQADYTSGSDNFLSIGAVVTFNPALQFSAAWLLSNQDTGDQGYLLSLSWTPAWR